MYVYICILYMYLDTSNIYASYVSLLSVAASGDALKTLHLLPRERESELDGGKERARVCDSFATWWILVALKAISTPISHRFKVVLVSIRMAFKQSFLKQTHKHSHTHTHLAVGTWMFMPLDQNRKWGNENKNKNKNANTSEKRIENIWKFPNSFSQFFHSFYIFQAYFRQIFVQLFVVFGAWLQ